MSLFEKGLLSRNPVLWAATGSAALLLAAAGGAWAGPKEDLKAVSAKFLALRSYHVSMTNSDKRVPAMEMDFVAPNRYRMSMPMGTQYVIGETMYMTIDGRTMKVPMPKGVLDQWRQSDRVFRQIDQLQIEALGSETVDGASAKKYRMTQTGKTPTTSLIWVGGDGYPIKIETSGTAGGRTSTVTIRYSRLNDPKIKIDVPN